MESTLDQLTSTWKEIIDKIFEENLFIDNFILTVDNSSFLIDPFSDTILKVNLRSFLLYKYEKCTILKDVKSIIDLANTNVRLKISEDTYVPAQQCDFFFHDTHMNFNDICTLFNTIQYSLKIQNPEPINADDLPF